MLKKISLKFIKFYQKTLSIDHGLFYYFHRTLGLGCRFQPTCSEYTYQAIEKYGAFKGIFMGVKRISRCHPMSRGGYDPVK
ncbi:membrane protein insertion efficiency factor YidD [Candidatus Parcubacteria bacterium]|nr:membrane protein insertion efficiency factor YidD [Candidatus Parcubacteria bacterium]